MPVLAVQALGAPLAVDVVKERTRVALALVAVLLVRQVVTERNLLVLPCRPLVRTALHQFIQVMEVIAAVVLPPVPNVPFMATLLH